MNICLSSVTPNFFLLVEARFGPSTLQNYEGILRNQLTAPRLHILWRLLLATMVALPVALSVAYKTFIGGESVKIVNPATYIQNESYYGMFGPPGLQTMSQRVGLSLFFNATLPFVVASTSSTSAEYEVAVPPGPRLYGMNTLLINKSTAAILDIPQPDYISQVQSLLAEGESWQATASVFATVASYNQSQIATPSVWNETFQTDYKSGTMWVQYMYNSWNIVLVSLNNTRQYIALPPGDGHERDCYALSRHVHEFDISRQRCKGTWNITRGSIILEDAICGGAVLPAEQQLIFTFDDLELGVWYIPALIELLGPFAKSRNESHWLMPYYAVATASMLWSRTMSVWGAGFYDAVTTFDNVSYEKAGLIYPVKDKVMYFRPTLKKSPALYILLALQPFLLIAILCLSVYLCSEPISRGFGLTSILSGVDPNTLNILHGATLSGELQDDVKISLQPVQHCDRAYIKYSILSSEMPTQNGKLSLQTTYS